MNSNIEHQATVDKGLKMKIKRKNVSGANNKAEPKHEIVKSDSKCTSSSSSSSSSGASSSNVGLTTSSDTAGSGGGTGATNQGGGTTNTPGSTSGNTTANGVLLPDKIKPSPTADNSKQEKSPKMKGSHKKEKVKDKNKNSNNNTSTTTNTITSSTTTTTTTTTPASSSSSLTTSSSSSSSTSSSLSSSATSCVATSCTPSSTSSSSCPSSASSSSCAPLASGADCCVSNGSNNNTNSSSSSSSSSASTPAAAASITNGLDTSSPVIYNNNSNNNSNSNTNNSNNNANSSNNSSNNSTSMVEPRGGDVPHLKKENPTPDPYEFNAKVEDGFGIPIKKIKVEKVEAACSPMQPEVHDIGIDTCSVGVITEPECLGPCEPGTSVTLEGIVWHETENGVLVINVTWRGKTYVGTLLDATKHDWAPPSQVPQPNTDGNWELPGGGTGGGGGMTKRSSCQTRRRSPH